MLEILNYTFFQNALIGGILIALISSIFGVFIVMRKEANITHSISNFLFFGIAISIIFNGNYYLYAFIFGIIGSILIFLIEKNKLISKESSKEIISQAGMAAGIVTIGFIGNLNIDINNLLFGSILFINKLDIFILIVLLIVCFILYMLFGKNFLSIIINEDIAKTKGINTNIYNLIFIIILSIFIGISIKIFGIMLVGAFLIIPTNTAKLISSNFKTSLIFTNLISILAVVLGLFVSYFLNTNTGGSIVLILIILFISGIIHKKIKK